MPAFYKNNTTASGTFGLAISKFCYVTVSNIASFLSKPLRFQYRTTEECDSLSDFNHPPVKALSTLFPDIHSLNLATHSDLPGRTGVGSSSAFVATLIQGLTLHTTGNMRSRPELAKLTIHVEQDLLKEDVGIQDQILTVNGGINFLNIANSGLYNLAQISEQHNVAKLFEDNLYLLYLGKRRSPSERASSNLSTQIMTNPELFSQLHKQSKLYQHAYQLYQESSFTYEKLCDLVNESFDIKSAYSDLKNRSPETFSLIAQLRDCGVDFVKTCGSAGSGFLVFACTKDSLELIIKKLNPGKNLIKAGIESTGTTAVKLDF